MGHAARYSPSCRRASRLGHLVRRLASIPRLQRRLRFGARLGGHEQLPRLASLPLVRLRISSSSTAEYGGHQRVPLGRAEIGPGEVCRGVRFADDDFGRVYGVAGALYGLVVAGQGARGADLYCGSRRGGAERGEGG